MRTTKPKAATAARIGAALARRKRVELLELLRPCFARTEAWLQAAKYAAAVMSQIPRRNGWTIAAQAGDRTPDKTQRLLSRAVWDTFAAMGVVRRFAVAGLDEAAARAGRRCGLAVGALDETGQVKAGELTVGVKRQCLGCVGKVANGINTVHLAYVRGGTGHALIGAREWIQAAQIGDPATSAVMGLPEDLVFRTKGQLAIDILTEALADGVQLDFGCGDEVYGSCTQLRAYLEGRGQAYVLRVPSSFRLALAGGITLTCKQAAGRLGRRGWEIRSAGTGSKGQRWYAGAWLGIASARHHLLIRRHLATAELAFHYCFLPDGQPASASRPVRAAGPRWPAARPAIPAPTIKIRGLSGIIGTIASTARPRKGTDCEDARRLTGAAGLRPDARYGSWGSTLDPAGWGSPRRAGLQQCGLGLGPGLGAKCRGGGGGGPGL